MAVPTRPSLSTPRGPRLDLREGWSLRLLLSSRVGPELSGLQGLLSASPGSFPGTFSFTSVILLIESGWGGKRGRCGRRGRGRFNYRGGWGSGARPVAPDVDPTEGAGRAASGREAGRTARRKGNPRSERCLHKRDTAARAGRPSPPEAPAPGPHQGSGSSGALTSPRRPAAARASAGRRPSAKRGPYHRGGAAGGGGRQGPRGGVQAGGPSPASPPAPASGWRRPGFEHKPRPVSGATGLGTCRRRGGRKRRSEGLCPQGLEAAGDLARPCPAFPALREKDHLERPRKGRRTVVFLQPVQKA